MSDYLFCKLLETIGSAITHLIALFAGAFVILFSESFKEKRNMYKKILFKVNNIFYEYEVYNNLENKDIEDIDEVNLGHGGSVTFCYNEIENIRRIFGCFLSEKETIQFQKVFRNIKKAKKNLDYTSDGESINSESEKFANKFFIELKEFRKLIKKRMYPLNVL